MYVYICFAWLTPSEHNWQNLETHLTNLKLFHKEE